MKTRDELVDGMLNVMERFDFGKVHAYMVLKDWKVEGEIPTEKKLMEWSQELLEQCIGGHLSYPTLYHISSNEDCGLCANLDLEGIMKLSFFIEQKSSYQI